MTNPFAYAYDIKFGQKPNHALDKIYQYSYCVRRKTAGQKNVNMYIIYLKADRLHMRYHLQ